MKDQLVNRKRLLFIVNPISGTGNHRDIDDAIQRWLDHTKCHGEIVYTEYRGHASILATQAVEDGIDVVVAVGGDGTVNEISRSLVGSSVALAVIPAGSGNGLARHLGLPVQLKKAIGIINEGKSKRIDTATLNDHFFVNIAGVGYDAYIARKFDQLEKRGFFSYFRLATRLYSGYKPKQYSILIDGVKVKRRALMISFANSSQFGNNTSVDPGASIDDGLIDVCIVRKLPFWKVTILAPLLFMKKFDKTPYVEIIKARQVIVKRKKGKYIHLDGDPEKEKKSIDVRVHPLSLHVIIP